MLLTLQMILHLAFLLEGLLADGAVELLDDNLFEVATSYSILLLLPVILCHLLSMLA